MASKSSDDPMDLGPFLQNYVLRNPFHEFMLGSSQLSDVQPKGKDHSVRKMIVLSGVDGIQSDLPVSSQHAGRSKRSARLDEDSSADGVRQSKAYEKTEKFLAACADGSSQLLVEAANSGLPFVVEAVIKQEVDIAVDNAIVADNSGRASGSSAVVEIKDILSKYSDVYQWLLSNFKYLSRFHNCLTSARILLNKVQKTFPNIKRKTLSQLITVTYPRCSKIVQDGEIFYQGLVPKLAENILENASPNFMTALENVTKGQMSIQKAAEKFDVYEASLKSVLMWDQVDLASTSCSGQMQVIVPQSNGSAHSSQSSSQEFVKEASSTRSVKKHYQSFKRARLSVVTNDPQAESNDSVDFETMLQNIHGEATARKIVIRPSSSNEIDRLLPSSDDSQVPVIKEELADVGNNSRTESKRSSGTFGCSGLGTSSTAGDVTTIEDPQTVGSDSSESLRISNGDLEASVLQNPSSSKFSRNVRFLELHSNVSEPPTSDSSSELEVRFQRTQQDLARCQSVNSKLKTELESIQNENLLLKEELNTRDFHLVHLAEDFFKLHGQFKQLAEQFQLILSETQGSLNHSFQGNNSR